ncbi:MAG: hypothetical protein L0206_07960 [Actinobacteria bacterium]|nr:hypothetical protein [Actinomycetota bacterium]
MGGTVRSATLSVTIEVPYDVAFDYLSDGRHAAEWGINFVRGVKEASEGGLTMVTPYGDQPFRVRADRETGIVDHFVGDDFFPARVVANGEGVDYTITLQQPANMPDEAFDGEGVPGLREEMETLKKILESKS